MRIESQFWVSTREIKNKDGGRGGSDANSEKNTKRGDKKLNKLKTRTKTARGSVRLWGGGDAMESKKRMEGPTLWIEPLSRSGRLV